MDLETTKNFLSGRDLEKLRELQKSIIEGTACTYDKARNEEYLESILNPKCVVCRKLLDENIIIVNDKKMHPKCRKKYKG